MNKKINTVFFRSQKKIIVIAAIISCFIIYSACTNNESKSGKEITAGAEEMVTATITISPNVPLDLSDPSNLAEAANFAWNEFIALTWPADSAGRGKPFINGKYGDKGPGGHVVWETYRAKVEAFPGMGNPNGYDPGKADLGFSSPPDYIYQPGPGIDPSGHVMPYPGTNPGPPPPPAHNLDEVTQITLNSMYAGVVTTAHAGTPGTQTNVKQKVLFEAKVNEEYYKYVAGNKYFQSDSASVVKIKANSVGYAETGDTQKYPSPYMSLPASNSSLQNVGTVEIKAAFRRLDPKTEDITKFFTAPVRYYSNGGGRGLKGFYDSDSQNEVWGLVSLHIIHKTPNAPAFVYATFSQYNNILDANGNSVEDEVGNTLDQYKNIEPFSPALSITNDSNSSPTNPQSVYVKSGAVNTNSPQIYFRNASGKEAIYPDSTESNKNPLYSLPVSINRRLFLIPDIIINANKNAHKAIKTVNPNAVWLNYKLINVQAEPLDYKRDYARIFQGGTQGLAATFFLANEMVETNPSLQNFSGGLNALTGNITNKVYPDGMTPPAEYDYNVFIRQTGKPVAQYNMGGCMGCHGSQGLKAGGDFSVLLANGRVSFPEPVELDERTAEAVERLTKKYFPNRFKPK